MVLVTAPFSERNVEENEEDCDADDDGDSDVVVTGLLVPVVEPTLELLGGAVMTDEIVELLTTIAAPFAAAPVVEGYS